MRITIRLLCVVCFILLLSGCGSSGFNTTLTDMLDNIAENLNQVWAFLVALSYTLGIIFIVIAVMKLKQYGHMTVMQSTHATLGGTFAFFIVGMGLLYLPSFLDTWLVTAWLYKVDGIEGAGGVEGIHANFMKPIIMIVQVMGLVSFIRGWISLSKLGNSGAPPGTLSKGLMHMIGGILAINFTGTLDILKSTLGIS